MKSIFRLFWPGWACLLLLPGLGLPSLHAQAVAQLIFEDDFEEGAFGSQWTARPNLAGTNGVVEILPNIGAPSFGVRIGKSLDGPFTTNALDLTLDLSGYSQVNLSFDIRDRLEESQNADGLFLSNDGGQTFHKVLDFEGDEWCDFAFSSFPPLDIDKLAQENPALGLYPFSSQFVIRWQQRGLGNFDNAGERDGIFLDNVQVYVPDLEYAPLPFYDGFEAPQLSSNWAWRFADDLTSANSTGIITRPSNTVEVFTWNGAAAGANSLRMGKLCEDGMATNAVDLHLDLLGETEVEMTFFLLFVDEQQQEDEGIYFSDDGGTFFTKVYTFYPDEWCGSWGKIPPIDVDELAERYGLALTDQFVIRFQQRGNADLVPNNGLGGDGYYLDEVRVYRTTTEYAQVPFSDSFENGLRPWWQVADADSTVSLLSEGFITKPSNIVRVVSNVAIDGAFSLQMGKSCDDGPSASAVDLHLNLEGLSNLILEAQIREVWDESQVDDGLFLSNDGGRSFVQIDTLDYGSNNAWDSYRWNLSEIFASLQIIPSDSVLIRFQQFGDSDFGQNSAAFTDGIYLDDVSVTGTPTSRDRPQASLLHAYPNPTRDFLTLTLPTGGEQQLSLFDLHGRPLSVPVTWQGNEARLDLSHLPTGLYQLRLQADGLPYRLPVVKQ